MKRHAGRIVVLVAAVVLAIQASSARAGGDEAVATDNGRIEMTYTKWIVGAGPLMAGVVGGDVEGVFAGEVLERKVSVNLLVTRLGAVYEIQAGDRSFTAIMEGAQTNPGGNPFGGRAALTGFILTGWRAGADVRAEYVVGQDCEGAPLGRCFVGTITIQH
jgi:hypothetical protein